MQWQESAKRRGQGSDTKRFIDDIMYRRPLDSRQTALLEVYWCDIDNWRFNGSQRHWFMKINVGRINCPLSSRAENCIIKAKLYLALHVYTRIVRIFTYCFVVLVMDIKPVSLAALTLSIILIKDRGNDHVPVPRLSRHLAKNQHVITVQSSANSLSPYYQTTGRPYYPLPTRYSTLKVDRAFQTMPDQTTSSLREFQRLAHISFLV
jgi:hypothetical protein